MNIKILYLQGGFSLQGRCDDGDCGQVEVIMTVIAVGDDGDGDDYATPWSNPACATSGTCVCCVH